jgi:predicted RNA-binding Zn-ribbon protein involved in translation (DUF1610 family)
MDETVMVVCGKCGREIDRDDAYIGFWTARYLCPKCAEDAEATDADADEG